MGCKNSGAYLEAMLNIILDKKNFDHFIEVNPSFNVEYFLNNCIINHADDFLIASTNEKYHILDLEAFFYIMHKFNIRLSLNKSAFFQSEFIFLGIKYNTQNQKMFLGESSTNGDWDHRVRSKSVLPRLCKCCIAGPAVQLCAYTSPYA